MTAGTLSLPILLVGVPAALASFVLHPITDVQNSGISLVIHRFFDCIKIIKLPVFYKLSQSIQVRAMSAPLQHDKNRPKHAWKMISTEQDLSVAKVI